jgi:hypothetical protein
VFAARVCLWPCFMPPLTLASRHAQVLSGFRRANRRSIVVPSVSLTPMGLDRRRRKKGFKTPPGVSSPPTPPPPPPPAGSRVPTPTPPGTPRPATPSGSVPPRFTQTDPPPASRPTTPPSPATGSAPSLHRTPSISHWPPFDRAGVPTGTTVKVTPPVHSHRATTNSSIAADRSWLVANPGFLSLLRRGVEAYTTPSQRPTKVPQVFLSSLPTSGTEQVYRLYYYFNWDDISVVVKNPTAPVAFVPVHTFTQSDHDYLYHASLYASPHYDSLIDSFLNDFDHGFVVHVI